MVSNRSEIISRATFTNKMDRRAFLTQAAAGLTIVQADQEPAAKTPNILHIMSDQQQWATVAGRSLCRTPRLNQLAAEGMLFERSYTPVPVCCPARAMILSGSYPWHNGVFNQVHSPPSVHRDMFSDVVLYSHRLKERGYQQGYVGKWHASWTRSPLDFGFNEMAGVHGCDPALLAHRDLNPDKVERPREKLEVVPHRKMQWPGSEPFTMWGQTEGPLEATDEYQTAEYAARMLKRFSQGSKPWHLEVHFDAPHDAYLPHVEYLQRYNAADVPVPKSFYDTFDGKPGMHKRESETWGSVSEEDYRQGRAHYYAFTEQLDAQIGRILDALDQSGQASNTLVVCTTDHGDMAGAHRMWIKGWIPYEECYRVPLIIRWPGKIRSGGRTSHLVQTHDLAHTYVEMAHTAALPFADGRSLIPLFEAPDRTDWPDMRLGAFYGGEFLYTQRVALTKRFKYVFNGFDIDELYDLERDPEEMHNVAYAGDYRREADDMRARMYELMAQFEDPYGDRPLRREGFRYDRYGAARYLPRGTRM